MDKVVWLSCSLEFETGVIDEDEKVHQMANSPSLYSGLLHSSTDLRIGVVVYEVYKSLSPEARA